MFKLDNSTDYSFSHQKGNFNENMSSPHKTVDPIISASNKIKKKYGGDLEYDTNSNSNSHHSSASETNSLFDQKDDNSTDNNESEMDSLFDYDGSGEEADEEGSDSDVSLY